MLSRHVVSLRSSYAGLTSPDRSAVSSAPVLCGKRAIRNAVRGVATGRPFAIVRMPNPCVCQFHALCCGRSFRSVPVFPLTAHPPGCSLLRMLSRHVVSLRSSYAGFTSPDRSAVSPASVLCGKRAMRNAVRVCCSAVCPVRVGAGGPARVTKATPRGCRAAGGDAQIVGLCGQEC